MSVWASATTIYGLVGLAYAVSRWREDWDRAKRARDLRDFLDIKVPQHPLWCEVLALSIIRAVVWPLHLIIHDL